MKLFATVEPGRVNLQGVLGETVSQTVTIIPETEPPFKILQVNAMKGTDFTHTLKETEIKGKKAYELTVTNKRETEGRYYDKLILLTDQTDHEPLMIIVSGELRKPGAEKAATPPQMTIQPAPASVPVPK